MYRYSKTRLLLTLEIQHLITTHRHDPLWFMFSSLSYLHYTHREYTDELLLTPITDLNF